MLVSLLVVASLAININAQDSVSSNDSATQSSAATTGTLSATSGASGTVTKPSFSPIGSVVANPSVAVPTGSYHLETGTQMVVATQLTTGSTSSIPSNSTLSSTSNTLELVGQATSTTNGTATTSATSSSVMPTNTQPCNGYTEFCSRKYSNITQVCAHNSALAKENNAFSNQQIAVAGQLNDGVRMIQGEVHHVNGTMYNCHSSCDLLNTGPYEDTLRTVTKWLANNPYDVVTLLIVNSNYANVTAFESAFQNSGILDYIYLPSRRPMRLGDWPTLQDMILTNSRAVVFMDYNADASLVPYILDEFSNMWETPFSPTDRNFPCSQQRPPDLSTEDARNEYLYLANHNLNVQIDLGSNSILIPNFADLDLVNANNDSIASLESMANRCTQRWNRPPNFLLVDFYDISAPAPGAVFQVAAEMNNVTYTGTCCGQNDALASAAVVLAEKVWQSLALAAALVIGVVAFLL